MVFPASAAPMEVVEAALAVWMQAARASTKRTEIMLRVIRFVFISFFLSIYNLHLHLCWLIILDEYLFNRFQEEGRLSPGLQVPFSNGLFRFFVAGLPKIPVIAEIPDGSLGQAGEIDPTDAHAFRLGNLSFEENVPAICCGDIF